MKKVLKSFVVIMLISVMLCSHQTMADSSVNYTYKKVTVDGRYSDTKTNRSYKKIIRTYKQLTKLKKYIKKNYKNPNKYLKKLKKYKKSFFKKKALVFVTENVDVHTSKYKLTSVRVKNNKLYLNINQYSTLKPGQYSTCVIEYKAKTYLINIKKSKIKNIKKVKTKYHRK